MPRVRKTVLFNGQRYTILNISRLDRHSTRPKYVDPKRPDKALLTPGGRRRARAKGRALPKNLALKMYFSRTDRTRNTAELIQTAHVRTKGIASPLRVNGKVKGVRPEIGTDITHKPAVATELYNRLGAEKSNRLWLDGKYDASIAEHPKEVADRIIRKRFGLVDRAGRMGVSSKQVLNISHDFIIQAVIERLLGVHMGKAGMRVPRPNQGLTIYHTKEGRILAEYAKKRTDVTDRFYKILNRELP